MAFPTPPAARHAVRQELARQPLALPARVQTYIEALVQMYAQGRPPLVSVVLFGSAAKGGFSGTVSDVDIIIVVADDASRAERRRLGEDVARLEAFHGLHSLHSCYFCYHGRTAALEVEVDFFRRRLRASQALVDLLALRGEYRRSFAFVIGCLPTLVRLHLRTARDNRFPLEAVHGPPSSAFHRR